MVIDECCGVGVGGDRCRWSLLALALALKTIPFLRLHSAH